MARCGAVASWAALGRAQQLAKPGALLRTNKSERSSGAIYFAHLVFFFVKFFFRPDHECWSVRAGVLFFLSEPVHCSVSVGGRRHN